MKFAFMQSHADKYSIERMSKMLNVSRSAYYKFIRATPSTRTEERKRLLQLIKEIYAKNRRTYGSPRIHAALIARGETCSRQMVASIMRKEGIQAKMKKRFKVTTKVNLITLCQCLTRRYLARSFTSPNLNLPTFKITIKIFVYTQC